MLRGALPLLLVAVACAHPAPTPPTPAARPPAVVTAAAVPPATEQIAADSPRETSGATFTVPAGWSLTRRDALAVLQPPEADAHIAILDVPAPDAAAAVQAAWAAYRPEAKRSVKLVTPQPPREGWEERQVFQYETSPNEKVVVVAFALRKGQTWTAVILDGSEATFEKRGSPVGLVVQSLRPKGYARESFAGKPAHRLDAQRIATLKAFVQKSMDLLGVPGVGLAFIDQGKVVDEGGLGVRELGKPAPVDASTLFMAASNTKGMTTLLLARLVDAGKLTWDEPVVKAYPAFQLGDPSITSQVLFRHLICACTGLPRQDLEFIFEFADATPASTFALLAKVKPTSKFGEVFQYSNLMASAAGYIGGHLYAPKLELGAAYDRAMQKLIFDPLQMRSTTFDMARALRANHASPHGEDADGKLQVEPMDANYCIVPHRPAGGVWTSAHDFARYVQLELLEGKLPSGKQLVSAKNLLARRAPQIPLGENASYGMGLMVDRTWGVPVVHHGGDVIGYHSDFYALPEQGVGVVLLTNGDTGPYMRRPLMRRLLEVLFDGNPEAEADVAAQAGRHKAEVAKERERLAIPADSTAVSALASRYRSPDLGGLTVVKRDQRTIFDFGEWRTAVASRKNDDGTLSFIGIDPSFEGIEFVVGEHNGKRVLITRDGQHEYAFSEVGS